MLAKAMNDQYVIVQDKMVGAAHIY